MTPRTERSGSRFLVKSDEGKPVIQLDLFHDTVGSLYGSNCPKWRLLRFAGNQQYLLDSQKKARKYKGKDVKITGTLDKAKNLIHVEKIDESPSM